MLDGYLWTWVLFNSSSESRLVPFHGAIPRWYFFFLLLLIRFSDASQYYHFISKVRLFFTWMITYSGSLDWHAPRQRACPLAAMSTGVRIGVAGADNALMVIYGQQRKSLSTFPLSFPSSRTVLHPQCWVHLPFFLSYALPSLLPAVT